MLKSVKSKVFVTALAIALSVPCQGAFAGVRAGGISVSRPSISVGRPSSPAFTPRVSAPVSQPARPVVINRTVSYPTAPAPVTSGGSSFIKDVAASAVGSAVGAGIVNYAMKPSAPATTSAGVPAQQAHQQIPTLKPSEVIIDCNNVTFRVLDICRGRSTQ